MVRFWLSLEGGAEMAGGQFAGDCGQESGMILKCLSRATGKLEVLFINRGVVAVVGWSRFELGCEVGGMPSGILLWC